MQPWRQPSRRWSRGEIQAQNIDLQRQPHTAEVHMQTLNEMLTRGLLSSTQHLEIGSWISHAKTPEAILRMPAHLWKAFELAAVLMNVDADLTQPPLLAE